MAAHSKGAHTRSIMLRNIACCVTWLIVYGADWLDREWPNLCCAKQFCATWLIVYGPLKAYTIFYLSITGIMGSNPTWGTDICLSFFLLSRESRKALRWADPPIQRVLPNVSQHYFKTPKTEGLGPHSVVPYTKNKWNIGKCSLPMILAIMTHR
jgi:hypothetical protein